MSMHAKGIFGIRAQGSGLLLAALCGSALANWTPQEVVAVQNYWKAPGRYEVLPSLEATKGTLWVVRLTAEGSQWLWNYNKARGLGKTAPSKDAPPQTPEQEAWERWINAKVAFDRWQAGKTAATENAAIGQNGRIEVANPGDPGPAPDSLVKLVGSVPPPFASAVQPQRHHITFADGYTITYQDNPPMRDRYAYYRFPEGVMQAGKRVREMSPEELDALFADAGVKPSERKVMAAVSLLEGGFESVNTYDTGFVSVGFIQFACLKDGAGSLGRLLLRYKTDAPQLFQTDFRDIGLDVSADGKLEALDLDSGEMKTGAQAAAQIIKDKRLIAAFQRSGVKSKAFRVAQIREAKASYFPGEDAIAISVGGRTVSGKVSDFIKSEAGLATLMDRKVNTGKLDPLLLFAAVVGGELQIQSLVELAPYEREIVWAIQYRKNYLDDASLTQPGDSPRPMRSFSAASRHLAGRAGRTPPKPKP